jgi:hypothetical protein
VKKDTAMGKTRNHLRVHEKWRHHCFLKMLLHFQGYNLFIHCVDELHEVIVWRERLTGFPTPSSFEFAETNADPLLILLLLALIGSPDGFRLLLFSECQK